MLLAAFLLAEEARAGDYNGTVANELVIPTTTNQTFYAFKVNAVNGAYWWGVNVTDPRLPAIMSVVNKAWMSSHYIGGGWVNVGCNGTCNYSRVTSTKDGQTYDVWVPQWINGSRHLSYDQEWVVEGLKKYNACTK